MKKVKILVKKPWIAYPGSTIQQNYAESLEHGYLFWDIKSRSEFDVSFHPLINPKPFVTLEWLGSVDEMLDSAKLYPCETRFRIRHREHIPYKDVVNLTTRLKNERQASEVTFKSEQQAIQDFLTLTHESSVAREDLRNVDVLVKLVKDFHKDTDISDKEWELIKQAIQGYLTNLKSDEGPRNVSWTLKHLKFDNMFCYGENNVIDFQKLNGIVGIFGPNRTGKSSLPGTLAYALFNSSDRGSIKNLHVCNTRKPYCYSRVVLAVDGVDYAIERQTVKNEKRNGEVNATTSLNLFKVLPGNVLEDLVGEQRTDTEKTIRNLIGTFEDIQLTSLSAQDELNSVIKLGSTKRSRLLSRFMDLEIFYQMWQSASTDVNIAKGGLKQTSDKDFSGLILAKKNSIQLLDRQLIEMNDELVDTNTKLTVLKNNLGQIGITEPVTQFQIEQQKKRVITIEKDLKSQIDDQNSIQLKLTDSLNKIEKIDQIKKEYDLETLKKQQKTIRNLETSVASLKHKHSKEDTTLKQQKKSLKMLDNVPCGEQYPTCHYIKDAHNAKQNLFIQEETVKQALNTLVESEDVLKQLRDDNVDSKIDKLDELLKKQSVLVANVSDHRLKLAKLESTIATLESAFEIATNKLLSLESAFDNDENVEMVSMRNEISALQQKILNIDNKKLELATKRGREAHSIETLTIECENRQKALQQMKIYELISVAFSKKGIPNRILNERLPAINAEIAQILSGIVDFTVELQRDDSEQIEIYLNYGDSRRLIELGSGMEKVISSIAIRVAFRNVSSLPKSDFFIIDEGFGVFDDLGLEAVSRLLKSLKSYFRCLLIISHIDPIKDVADHIIELTKKEKDSYVCVT